MRVPAAVGLAEPYSQYGKTRDSEPKAHVHPRRITLSETLVRETAGDRTDADRVYRPGDDGGRRRVDVLDREAAADQFRDQYSEFPGPPRRGGVHGERFTASRSQGMVFPGIARSADDYFV